MTMTLRIFMGSGVRGPPARAIASLSSQNQMIGQTMSTNAKRNAAAAHEAGHAVVGLALGLDIVEVWIDDNGYGQTRLSADPPELLDRLTLAAAGGIANRAFDIEAPTDMLEAGRSEDEDARLRVAGRKRARELLTPNLALLRAVANELETVYDRPCETRGTGASPRATQGLERRRPALIIRDRAALQRLPTPSCAKPAGDSRHSRRVAIGGFGFRTAAWESDGRSQRMAVRHRVARPHGAEARRRRGGRRFELGRPDRRHSRTRSAQQASPASTATSSRCRRTELRPGRARHCASLSTDVYWTRVGRRRAAISQVFEFIGAP